MLQLYIDGERVNLSEDVRTDYYVRNPFFTNEGDFTLDIDINLNDPQNARVYNFLHRMDRVRRSSRREAVLQDEHGVLLRGQEVVLETRGGKAKIQIVGGASELNYMMSDKRLQDLDLWSEWSSDEVEYVPVCAFNNSPHAEFGLMDSAEYVTEENKKTLKWRIMNRPRWRQSDNGLEYTRECPQPYLWAIVNRVIAALGFTVGTNVIATDPKYSRMLMIHAYSSKYIADMLPRWTVSEFFDEIQKFFNVIVDVDKTTRTVNLIHAYEFFNVMGLEVVSHQDVIQSTEKVFDRKSEMTMVDYSSVHYAFTDKALNKYSALSRSLVQVCDAVNSQSMSGGRPYDTNYYAGIWKAIEGNESFLTEEEPTDRVKGIYGDRKIYHQHFGTEDRSYVLWSIEDDYTALKMVNMFGPKQSVREDVTDVELKIVPARMVTSPIQGNNSHWWQYPLPAVDGEASSYGEVVWGGNIQVEKEENLNDDIKSGYDEEKKDDHADVMFTALYFGEMDVNWEDPSSDVPSGIVVPVAAPDFILQLHRLSGTPGDGLFWKSSRHVRLGFGGLMTLALTGPNGMDAYSYSRNPIVDTSTEYHIKFRARSNHDVRKIWLIENRKFYCKELKYDIKAAYRSEVAEGVFFPLLEAGKSEGGESVYYVTYNLSRVVIAHRVLSVMSNEALHLELKLDGGGSASATVHAVVLMGNVDVTQTAYTSHGRTGEIDIAHVTGDVYVKAWKE